MNALTLLAQTLANDWWSQQLFGLNQEQRFVLLLMSVICITVVVTVAIGVINSAINSFHRRRSETNLKRELIERGMSAEEISKIVEASPCEDFLSRWAKNRKQ